MTPQEKFHIEHAIMTQLSKKGWTEKNIYELIQQVMDGVDTTSSTAVDYAQQNNNSEETRGEFLRRAFPKAFFRRSDHYYPDPSKCTVTMSFDGIHDQTFDEAWWNAPFRSVKTDSTGAEPTAKPTATERHTVPTRVRFKDAPLMHTLEYGNMKVLKINNERCSKVKDASFSKSNVILLCHDNHFGVICDNMMFYDRGIIPEDIEAYNKRLKEGVRF